MKTFSVVLEFEVTVEDHQNYVDAQALLEKELQIPDGIKVGFPSPEHDNLGNRCYYFLNENISNEEWDNNVSQEDTDKIIYCQYQYIYEVQFGCNTDTDQCQCGDDHFFKINGKDPE
jgi:hypothetical protein